jgi:hypothetical protein
VFWLFTIAALASPPDRVVQEYAIGNGVVKRFATNTDGSLVAGIEQGTHTGFVVSTDAWSLHDAAPCTVKAVAMAPGEDDTTEVYFGCEDSTVHLMLWDGSELTTMTDADGDVVVDVGLAAIKAMFYHETSETIYVVAEGTAGNYIKVATIDAVDYALNTNSNYPVQLVYGGFQDASMDGNYLSVAHGNDDISTLVPGSSAATVNLIPTIPLTIEDLEPSLNGVYCADSGGRLAEYYPSSQQFTIVMSDLGDLTSVAVSWETDDEWLMLGTEDVEIYDMTAGVIDGSEPIQSVDVPQNVKSLFVGTDGYVFAGGGQGDLYVLTANPWVSIVETAPSAAALDSIVTISFSVDIDSEYEVRLGGSRAGDGTLLAEGEALAEAVVDASFTVDDAWVEGRNEIFVIATDSQLGQGHAKTQITVDNPPATLRLVSADLGFADSALVLSFDGIDDEDIDHYEVYVTTTEFSPDDWSTGGPVFDGPDELTTPITVDSDPGSSVSIRIEPLTNGQQYYVAVRAYDEGGLEGAMSNVLSASPRPAYSASELAGETGGMSCSGIGAGASTVGWLAIFLTGIRRRGRFPAAMLTVFVLGSILGSQSAWAGAKDPVRNGSDDSKRDMTRTVGNMEMRYGNIVLADPNIRAVYGGQIGSENASPQGTGNGLLQLEFGPQIFRVFELDVGVGFFQALANTVDSDGSPSSEKTMLTWYPLSLDGTIRAHFFDEQFLVPYARYGYDYILWNEKWDDGAGGKNKLGGSKSGSHYGYGVSLLLDTFSRGRASLLEAQTGINDTFLTVEWRRQAVDSGSGLIFSGEAITVGLKLDY